MSLIFSNYLTRITTVSVEFGLYIVWHCPSMGFTITSPTVLFSNLLFLFSFSFTLLFWFSRSYSFSLCCHSLYNTMMESTLLSVMVEVTSVLSSLESDISMSSYFSDLSIFSFSPWYLLFCFDNLFPPCVYHHQSKGSFMTFCLQFFFYSIVFVFSRIYIFPLHQILQTFLPSLFYVIFILLFIFIFVFRTWSWVFLLVKIRFFGFYGFNILNFVKTPVFLCGCCEISPLTLYDFMADLFPYVCRI